MSKNTLEDFRISMELSLEGIGAALRSEDGYTTVAEVVPGGAAEKDGRLKVGDKIIGVAQANEKDFTDIVEMKLTRVVRLIRGAKDTVVRLQVKTADGEIKTYDLTRQKIELKSSAVRGEIVDTGKRLGDRAYRIGIVHIPSFYRDFRGAQAGAEDFKSTSRDVLKVLKEFRDQGGVDGIVVDLRYNGGGALAEAIEVSGLFIDKGPVVQVKEQDGSIRSHDDVDPAIAYSGPLVVLCNRLSASASEIFAGAIKDYHRGLVIGDTTTHGKGTVQQVMPVPPQLFAFLGNAEEHSALKLTVQQFYRVNGDSTQRIGVPSDIILPSMFDHLDLGEEFLDNALPFSKIAPAAYKPVGPDVDADSLAALRERSARRVAADPDFMKLQKDIVKFVDRKADKSISLNEQKRLEGTGRGQAEPGGEDRRRSDQRQHRPGLPAKLLQRRGAADHGRLPRPAQGDEDREAVSVALQADGMPSAWYQRPASTNRRPPESRMPWNATHFDATIRTFRQRVPFRRFTLSLVNGDRLEIDHADAIVVRDGVGLFVGPGGVPAVFDHKGVVQVIDDLAQHPAS